MSPDDRKRAAPASTEVTVSPISAAKAFPQIALTAARPDLPDTGSGSRLNRGPMRAPFASAVCCEASESIDLSGRNCLQRADTAAVKVPALGQVLA